MKTVLPELLRERVPVFAAPMAGGPSTPELVIASAVAGHFAQLAGGYRTTREMSEQIDAVRAEAALFGINLFVPTVGALDPAEYRRYRDRLRPVAERLGIAALPPQREDDDSWAEKVDLLMQDPVPVVSFTFGIPSAGIVKALRTRGTITMQTVTCVEEALAARDAGIDVIVAQSRDAGGHVGTTDPLSALPTHSLSELVREIRSVSTLPIIGTGGISTSSAVHTTMAAGAQAVAVGTALLLAPESGASAVYKTALRDSKYTRTQVTRAFTGRFARALVNQFVEDHSAAAPAGYPALHHLTKPIRAAGAAAGDASVVHLWAGTGWQQTRERPVTATLAQLSDGL
ncbi:nitronate monooxygenase [Microbacterium sp. P04]|uniref:nitronate monooxygenase n=1 Tax=Microbacterium sp. P04 TaxID=3366947 RepID=UPI0037453C78